MWDKAWAAIPGGGRWLGQGWGEGYVTPYSGFFFFACCRQSDFVVGGSLSLSSYSCLVPMPVLAAAVWFFPTISSPRPSLLYVFVCSPLRYATPRPRPTTNYQRDRLPQELGGLRVLRLPRGEGVVDVPHEWNGDRHESTPARKRDLLPSQRGGDPVHTTSGRPYVCIICMCIYICSYSSTSHV